MANKKMSLKSGLMQLWVLVSLALMGFGASAAGQQATPDSGGHGAGASVQGEELTLFSFVGRIEQDGGSMVAYGYLTHIYGLNDADLFTGSFPPANPADAARYTFVTTGALVARYVVGNIFSVVANVSTTYYFEDQGAHGCVSPPGCSPDPGPFGSGTPIAASSGRDSDVNNVQAPGQGVLTGTGELTLVATPSNHSVHAPLSLWKPGVKVRITYVGEATRTDSPPDPTHPKSVSLIVGQGTVIR